ncbi:hypothetical protein BC831DRAFT_477245 [Entophlyctis helioformis]|nr:hypothetical protein BC831DRAFT_477245 [Entophlyctis helioformis]
MWLLFRRAIASTNSSKSWRKSASSTHISRQDRMLDFAVVELSAAKESLEVDLAAERESRKSAIADAVAAAVAHTSATLKEQIGQLQTDLSSVRAEHAAATDACNALVADKQAVDEALEASKRDMDELQEQLETALAEISEANAASILRTLSESSLRVALPSLRR